jgi:hypothetical protein
VGRAAPKPIRVADHGIQDQRNYQKLCGVHRRTLLWLLQYPQAAAGIAFLLQNMVACCR